jgi:hypothetical protein
MYSTMFKEATHTVLNCVMSNPKAEKEEIYEQFREKSHDKGKAY